MTRVVWHEYQKRTFEAGVDRGVLYVGDQPGVPWDGLISVAELPSGGELTPYYVDGIKYADHAANVDFNAMIEAYTYPEEFDVCDGSVSVGYGLSVTNQAKKPFGLCYRTTMANRVHGLNYAYKIHLVYNLTAEPTERSNNTLTDVIEPFNFVWNVAAVPPIFGGHKPTAHFEIDSRKTPHDLLQNITDILYGTDNTAPRLPSVPELMFMFQEYMSTVYDAGYLVDEYFYNIDSGVIPEPQTSTLDGGGP